MKTIYYTYCNGLLFENDALSTREVDIIDWRSRECII